MKKSTIYTILAEDDKDDAFLFNEAIDELPVSIDLTIVTDGEALMQQLSVSSLPDVIFLDINMPRKNGMECLSEIKENERFKEIPIIIFSTSFDEEIVNQLYINGADYYIQKPSGFSALKDVIEKALDQIARKGAIQPGRKDFVLSEKKIRAV